MLALGIVEKVNSIYSVKVRIPILHRAKSDVNATPEELLPDATICTFSNSYPNYTEGCVVVVGFDRNDLTSPIVLGELMTDKQESNTTDIKSGTLRVEDTCTLPYNTQIGSVSSHDIECVRGTKVNIQKQIDDIEERVRALEEEI